MKIAGSCLVAAATLLLPPVAQSQDANSAVANTPYASIVARNMFGLLPIPQHDPKDDQPPADPPPKITPNGIMTIFGKDQALFKVANKPKPGQPAKEDSYVLAEGEMQDDIEVVKINHQDEIITFNNHGVIQELPLVVAKETGSPPPGSGGSPGVRYPGMPQPGMVPPPRGGTFFQGHQIPRPGGTGMNPGNPGQPNSSGNTGLPSYQSTGNEQPQQQSIEDQVMSAARNMALTEQNRLATQEQVIQGTMPALPPTPMTPKDAVGYGGDPLIQDPEPAPTPAGRK